MMENSLVVLKKKSLINVVIDVFLKIIMSCAVIILILCMIIITKKIIWPTKIPAIFGIKPFIVLSGSMEPTIQVGDIVFIKEEKQEKINVGDIIAFRYTNEAIVTLHRITEKETNEEVVIYRTKGDNNQSEDRLSVTYDNIEGVYYSKIAKIGSIILAIRTPLGKVCSICFIIILFLCWQLKKIKNREKKLIKRLEEAEDVIKEVIIQKS